MIYAIYRPGGQIISIIETWDDEVVASPPQWHHLLGMKTACFIQTMRVTGMVWRVAKKA